MVLQREEAHRMVQNKSVSDAFGLIGIAFRELDRKTLLVFERAGPIRPNACFG